MCVWAVQWFGLFLRINLNWLNYIYCIRKNDTAICTNTSFIWIRNAIQSDNWPLFGNTIASATSAIYFRSVERKLAQFDQLKFRFWKCHVTFTSSRDVLHSTKLDDNNNAADADGDAVAFYCLSLSHFLKWYNRLNVMCRSS